MNGLKTFTIPLSLACLFAAAATSKVSGGNVGLSDLPPAHILTVPLDSLTSLDVQSVNENDAKPLRTRTEVTNYRGHQAVHLTTLGEGQALAVIKNSDFKNATIEAEIAGEPRASAPPDARGFIGIAFHIQENGSRYETIYLRMTNGRADDQLRRNHSAQYESLPAFPWYRLRKETPGVYESYVDLEPGAWTHIRIVVMGVRATLYVNGASQPCLIVNDLKLGETGGPVALWSGYDTEAYFSNLSLR